jgi:hypothetical protein
VGNEAQVQNPVHIRFDAGDSAPELVGFEAARFVKPGEDLPLTLYWRTDAPVADNLAMFVHVYDARGNLIGQWDAYPGNSLAPPRLWQPGEIVVDQYRVPVRPPDPYPPVGRIEVGMVRVGSSRPLAARNPDGQEIAPTLATFKFAQPVGLPADAIAFFDDAFRIVNLGVGARRGTHELTFDTRTPGKVALKPGDTLNVFVTLQAPRTPETNYTLFAHVVDAKGTIVAQRDSEPQNGTYPTTLWDPNEQVSVNLMMAVPRDAPMGPYTLEFGMYRSADVQRVPIVGKDWGSWQVRGDHLVAPVTLEDGG